MLVSDIIETSFGPIFTNYLFNALVILGVKSAHIRSYSGPYFPAFGLNMKRHSVSLRIQSEYGKIQTRITPNTGTFYAVIVSLLLISISSTVGYFGNKCFLFNFIISTISFRTC